MEKLTSKVSTITLKTRLSSDSSEERPSSDTSASSLEEEVPDEKPYLSQGEADTVVHLTSMSEKRQHAAATRSWVSKIYAKSNETFEGDDTTWTIEYPVCEDKEEIYGDFSAYARGVFKCTRVGDVDAEPAIMKIYLQTRGDAEGVPYWVEEEIAALEKIAHEKSKYQINAPQLLVAKGEPQEAWSWIPGGFTCFIVMEFCPGQQLSRYNFYSRPIKERDVIRQSFKRTLQQVWRAGIYIFDNGIHNLLWDHTTKTCYIIDFEGSPPADNPCGQKFDDFLDCSIWGLKGWQWRDGRLVKAFNRPDNEPPGRSGEDGTDENASESS